MHSRSTVNRYTPDNTIITFDLHDVLVRHDYKKMISLWWRCSGRWIIIGYLIHPKLLWRVFALRKQGAVAEKLLFALLNEFPSLKLYTSTAIAMLNAQKPIPESVHLLQKLKQQGYTLHLFSNIGEHLYKDLSIQIPELFTYFDAVHTTTQADNYLPKPQKQAFEGYLAKYNQNRHKHIIFIDNNRKNIAVANEHGMIGIHFTDAKKAQTILGTMT